MKPNIGQGDNGKTESFGAINKVWKDDLRVEAYGTVDELNSILGVVRAINQREEINTLLEEVQKNLFTVQSELAAANPPLADRNAPKTTKEDVDALEEIIERYEEELPELKNFILPGGSIPAALLHVARSVVRRAERRAVALSKQENVNPHDLAYLNRLADVFFTLARWVNKQEGVEEITWSRKTS